MTEIIVVFTEIKSRPSHNNKKKMNQSMWVMNGILGGLICILNKIKFVVCGGFGC